MTMETLPNGEDKARDSRGSEIGAANGEDYTDSTQSPDIYQGIDPSSIRLGSSGTVTQGSSPLTVSSPFGATISILGGIVTQLIERVESQLGEAVECVDWYERQRRQFQKELDNLRSLAESIKALQQPSVEQPEETE